MATIVLCAIILCAICVLASPSGERGDNGFTGFCWGAIVGLILCCIISCEHELGWEKPYVDKTIRLYALNDGSQIHGSFFLGSGTINEKFVYHFYKRVGTNTFRHDYIDASGVNIIENKNVNPRIEFYKKKRKKCKYGKWHIHEGERGGATKIFVPKGSIKNVYNLDLQ